MSVAYFYGRQQASLQTPFRGSRLMYAGQLLDGETIGPGEYEHCTFANISFKEGTLRDLRFIDCVFLNCYFRKSQVHGVHFLGCKFLECLFPGIRLESCGFDYVIFKGCYVDPGEMQHNLSTAPNLRHNLTANLAQEADSLGDRAAARRYRQWSVQAQEEHLLAAWRQDNTWYKQHYPFPRNWVALANWIGSRLNGWVWGYGERWGILVRNLVLLGTLLFPALFYWQREGLQAASAGSGGAGATQSSVGVVDVFFHSLGSLLPAANVSGLVPVSLATRVLTASEVLVGLIGAGLLVAYAFRSLDRGRG